MDIMYQGVIKNISTNKIIFRSEMFSSFKKTIKNINKRKIKENTQYRCIIEVTGIKKYRVFGYARISPRYAYGKNKSDAVKKWNKENIHKINTSELLDVKKGEK